MNEKINTGDSVEININGIPCFFMVEKVSEKSATFSTYVHSKDKNYSVSFPLSALKFIKNSETVKNLCNSLGQSEPQKFNLARWIKLNSYQSWLVNNCEYVTGMISV